MTPFWIKVNKREACNKNVQVCNFSKGTLVGGDVYSGMKGSSKGLDSEAQASCMSTIFSENHVNDLSFFVALHTVFCCCCFCLHQRHSDASK